MEYVIVKNLPTPVQTALTSVGYHKADIRVEASETVVLSSSSGDGYRAFVVLVDLKSGQSQTHQGSWGGANMFNPTNPVDRDNHPYPLPAHGIAITGQEGGTMPVYAVLHVPAAMVAKILPSNPVELTKDERNALYCHISIKGGQYRREELRRRRVPAEAVDSLVTRGLLKRNKTGAVAVTTEGKNALGKFNPYSSGDGS